MRLLLRPRGVRLCVVWGSVGLGIVLLMGRHLGRVRRLACITLATAVRRGTARRVGLGAITALAGVGLGSVTGIRLPAISAFIAVGLGGVTCVGLAAIRRRVRPRGLGGIGRGGVLLRRRIRLPLRLSTIPIRLRAAPPCRPPWSRDRKSVV